MPSAPTTAPIHAQHLNTEKDLLVTRLQQELTAIKQKLVEQSEELVQVRSSNLKLQEMLKKKEKDLQSVFAVMREGNTQGAAKRRKEITDRLVNELQQKVHHAEALAQARKLELDELKYSCKSLRLQELHIQAQEYYKEVQRLRDALAAQPATTPSPRKETRLQANNVEPETTLPVPKKEPVPQPIALPKTDVSASKFVKRKKQAVIEAEYRRQCRIAELAAQCEMEENIPRQAKRLAKQAAVEAAAREPPKQFETTPSEPKIQVAPPTVTMATPEVLPTEPSRCLQPAWTCPVCLSSTNRNGSMCETCGTARPSTEANTLVLCSICTHRPATHCSECAPPVVETPWPHIKPAQSSLLASSIQVSQRTYDALLVTIECARGLYDAQWVGKQDPYCFVTCGDVSFRTRTHADGGRDPAWHQELTFPPSCLDALMAIEIKDENYVHHDGYIGCCELPATAWHLSDVTNVWLPVQHHDTRVGELCVSIRKSLAAPKQEPKASSKSVVEETAADDEDEDSRAPVQDTRDVTPPPTDLVADSVDMDDDIPDVAKEEAPLEEEPVEEMSEDHAIAVPEMSTEHADEEDISTIVWTMPTD
ncbi:hypothetical protein SPRG_19781 [Saprolegnia parasitica CBS 223.65]|uniref:C2 domain-containing protein n=1 Tax=Saprolegnia parasitica (strain CBS 223.65) TaxID=695850 RepID=A0A067CIB0_SAPPC|nr:hypothetical protein SPRG_19781 [Saprolegnia parasitica CBS 223.65]KDO30223.1 hypothetical protein SPRG_19781 [Saprolegnia parasitica CBS 223.65]|eukprot:XP_012199034.1 hypothetical protein SPRG_19781 [Saprolegnia parasitica CBS 223.65]